MKIGLALSGGGALGAAHIGILEELEKGNIQINSISGTSSGAIIGLLYSYNGLDAINEFFSKAEQAGLFSKANLILKRNTTLFLKVEEILSSIILEKGFSALKVNFSCVATNIADGTMEIFNHGNPIKAVMASSAYPGVFPVQNIGNKFYVDGGLVKNLPASVLKDSGSEFVIGSSLYKIGEFKMLNDKHELKTSPLALAIRSLEIIEKQLADHNKEYCDFCFEPPVDSFQWYNFNSVAEIKQIGQEYAKAHIEQLLQSINNKQKPGNIWRKIFS